MDKTELRSVLDFNLALLKANTFADVERIFQHLCELFPIKKALMLNLNQAPADPSQSVVLLSAGEELHQDVNLSSSQYLSTNNEMSLALSQQQPMVISHPPKCPYNILGTNNLVGSQANNERQVSTVLALNFGGKPIANTYREMFSYLLPSLHEALLRHTPPTQLPELSQREYEVLNWIKQGKSNWDISLILSISERTVKYHISNISQKLNASNRTHALTKALQLKLISL